MTQDRKPQPKSYFWNIVIAICIIAIIIRFIILPLLDPCSFSLFGFYNQCPPIVICLQSQRLALNGRTCEPDPNFCNENQILSNGKCVDKPAPPANPPTNPPVNPLVNPPTNPSAPISPLLEADVLVRKIKNSDFQTQILDYQAMEPFTKNADHITEVIIVPRKNPNYTGLCRTIITTNLVNRDIPIILRTMGRIPIDDPPIFSDDLRIGLYYVWGTGDIDFTITDRNIALDYKENIRLSFT